MSALLPLSPRARQRGVVLVISLLLLLVLTMIGLAATRGTTIEQRMTAGQNDQEVAFEAAEAALRAGEGALASGASLNFAGNTAGAYTQATMGTTSWQNINWSPSGGAVTAYTGAIQPTPMVAPSYYIVLSPLSPPSIGSQLMTGQALNSGTLYYVYARGVGLTGNTAVILQSSYEISN